MSLKNIMASEGFKVNAARKSTPALKAVGDWAAKNLGIAVTVAHSHQAGEVFFELYTSQFYKAYDRLGENPPAGVDPYDWFDDERYQEQEMALWEQYVTPQIDRLEKLLGARSTNQGSSMENSGHRGAHYAWATFNRSDIF